MDDWIYIVFLPVIVVLHVLTAIYKYRDAQLVKAGRRKAELERLKSQRETPEDTP